MLLLFFSLPKGRMLTEPGLAFVGVGLRVNLVFHRFNWLFFPRAWPGLPNGLDRNFTFEFCKFENSLWCLSEIL